MRVGIRIGRVAEAVLLCVGASVGTGLSQSPATHAKINRELSLRLKNLDRSNAHRTIARLKRDGLIASINGKLSLTRSGRELILRKCLGIEPAAIPRFWDGRWRLVMFDIPEERELERCVLRRSLRAIGFELFQKSVWVHPAESCRSVTKIVAALGVERHVSYSVVDTLNDDRILRKKFGL